MFLVWFAACDITGCGVCEDKPYQCETCADNYELTDDKEYCLRKLRKEDTYYSFLIERPVVELIGIFIHSWDQLNLLIDDQ